MADRDTTPGNTPADAVGRHGTDPQTQAYGATPAGATPAGATSGAGYGSTDRHDRDGDGRDDRLERAGTRVHDRDGDGVDDRRQHAVDRDGDGRDDRTGAAVPTTAKEMAAVQRARFGGLHMGSAFFGWLCATGVAVILLAVLSAAGLAFGLNTGVDTADEAVDQASTGIGLGAAIALLVVLFLAYLAGGYVAGRMARFNGAKQGLGVWLWLIIITVLAAIAGLVLGSQYNVFDQLNLPALPVESGTATTAGLIALGAVLVVTLVGALLGGKLGSRYHRKVDKVGFETV
ncbi:hypothetical protein [Modestobacter sp. Leaf380]|uniref:hypothetical protein n=1 Tax=Modestobacter sp. Leaf380 TaxID=1736356 RepID=UPI000A653472|nr:hypothetical protein [Modestobacter sp. Leaf380]